MLKEMAKVATLMLRLVVFKGVAKVAIHMLRLVVAINNMVLVAINIRVLVATAMRIPMAARAAMVIRLMDTKGMVFRLMATRIGPMALLIGLVAKVAMHMLRVVAAKASKTKAATATILLSSVFIVGKLTPLATDGALCAILF